jgi:phage host-nuclease inhibitor protein Gam
MLIFKYKGKKELGVGKIQGILMEIKRIEAEIEKMKGLKKKGYETTFNEMKEELGKITNEFSKFNSLIKTKDDELENFGRRVEELGFFIFFLICILK